MYHRRKFRVVEIDLERMLVPQMSVAGSGDFLTCEGKHTSTQ